MVVAKFSKKIEKMKISKEELIIKYLIPFVATLILISIATSKT